MEYSFTLLVGTMVFDPAEPLEVLGKSLANPWQILGRSLADHWHRKFRNEAGSQVHFYSVYRITQLKWSCCATCQAQCRYPHHYYLSYL